MLSHEALALMPLAALRALAADFRGAAAAIDSRVRSLEARERDNAERIERRRRQRIELQLLHGAERRGEDLWKAAIGIAGADAATLFARFQHDMQIKKQRDRAMREVEIARLARQGYSNEEIGAKLRLSARTVRRLLPASVAATAALPASDGDQHHAGDQHPPKPLRQRRQLQRVPWRGGEELREAVIRGARIARLIELPGHAERA
jgi:hypothetical protein